MVTVTVVGLPVVITLTVTDSVKYVIMTVTVVMVGSDVSDGDCL